MRTLILVLLSGLLLAACANVEGDAVGECSDGADNDRDGRYDCQDPDCFGAPACADDDDDDSGAADDDDTTPGDDDDATPGDDDDTTTGDDDDTSSDDDDDHTDLVQVAGSAEFVIVTDIPQFEEFECVGTAAAEIDPGQGTLVGSGECSADLGGWYDVKVPFDFDCYLGQAIVAGTGTLYTDNVTMGMVDDLSMTLTGTYDEAHWLVEMDAEAEDNDGTIVATGTFAMDGQGN